MSTSSSLRQQFGAFCTNVPLGVRTLLEAPGLTTTLTAPKNGSVCVYPPLGERFSSTGSTVGGVLEKAPKPAICVCPPLEKGLLSPFPSSRGAVDRYHSLPNEDSDSPVVKSRKDAFWTYLLKFFASCHPTLPLFVSWFFMLPPPNRFSHRRPTAALPLCAFRSHV